MIILDYPGYEYNSYNSYGYDLQEGDDRTEAAFHGECVYSTLRIAKQHHNRAVRSTSHQVAH